MSELNNQQIEEVRRVSAVEAFQMMREDDTQEFMDSHNLSKQDVKNIIEKDGVGYPNFVDAMEGEVQLHITSNKEIEALEVDYEMIADYSPCEAHHAAQMVMEFDDKNNI